MDFSVRYNGKEIMDGPEKRPGSYAQAYKDISRCNALLGGHKANLKEVKRLINRSKQESYTIWDLGSGDGSTLRYLHKHLNTAGIQFKFEGFDLSELSVALAREQSSEISNMFFHHKDILTMDSAKIPDIILCNLTLHHFEDDQAKELLCSLLKMTRLGVVVNDLERNKWAYYLFKLFSLVFIKTSIAKTDGLISIRRSFVLKELKSWSESIPGAQHRIYWKRLFRLIWVLEPLQTNELTKPIAV
jgi:2-polyprenyl-3-methyl-5-hydroxy-6-metoxy-1,4-benzoquinol methylase